jgi:hypothetical protein
VPPIDAHATGRQPDHRGSGRLGLGSALTPGGSSRYERRHARRLRQRIRHGGSASRIPSAACRGLGGDRCHTTPAESWTRWPCSGSPHSTSHRPSGSTVDDQRSSPSRAQVAHPCDGRSCGANCWRPSSLNSASSTFDARPAIEEQFVTALSGVPYAVSEANQGAIRCWSFYGDCGACGSPNRPHRRHLPASV